MNKFGGIFVVVISLLSMGLAWQRPVATAVRQRTNSARVPAPTFYKDVLPILQSKCQSCHRSGEAAPMPLVTYAGDEALGAENCGCGGYENDATMVCRSAVREIFQRSVFKRGAD